ncbi:uncharacterized protein LOC127753475 [Oryza glaberrima]|uniref:uncharacterized protein LOC127753475 n=1 Tax=Oryza glaberrima TaxID=4538 RepID=UPI00023DC9D4|nr:uncharacterized protein LOC127753475 [Oryza glaberrima]
MSVGCHQSPYCGGGRGWLSPRCRTSGGYQEYDTGGGGASLTDDVLAAIFTRLPNAADVVRCAATCRRWASVVAKEADALSRALPPLPGLALGLFNQDRQDTAGAATTNTRKRKRRSTGLECSAPPCFVPTASGARLLGFNLPSTTALRSGLQAGGQHGHGVLDLSHSRPIASRNGRLVLELQSEGHVDRSLRLCVCNPMMEDVAVLPTLLGNDRPKIYACTLLTGADLDLDRPRHASSDFFRVLIIYNRDRFTAFRSYSSDTCSWSMETKKTSGPKLTNWDEWVRECSVTSTRLKVKSAADINLRWFCENSGILLFTLGRGSSNPGTFAMSLATKEVEKLHDSVDCSSWRNFVGYEMDGVTYLKSIACH